MSQKFLKYPRSSRNYLVDLTPDLWEYLDDLAKVEGESYRTLINQIIEDYATRNPIQIEGSKKVKKTS